MVCKLYLNKKVDAKKPKQIATIKPQPDSSIEALIEMSYIYVVPNTEEEYKLKRKNNNNNNNTV